MLFIFLILVFLICHQTPKKSLGRRLTLYYTSFLYLGITIFLYNQQKIDLSNWQSYFLLRFNDEKSGWISLLTALITASLTLLFWKLFQSGYLKKVYSYSRKNWLIYALAILLIFAGFLAYSSSRYAMKGIDNTSLDQILFTMSQPIRGSDPGQIINYMIDPLLEALLITVSLATLLYFATTCSFKFGSIYLQRQPHFKTKKVIIFGLIGLVFGIFLGGKEIGYADIRAFYFENTSIYDEHYMNPQEVDLKFPKKKRNLVYIFLESMESSYFSKELGGIQEHNLLPNFADLAQNEGINFSNSNKLGGMLQIPGANQTASSMVAQTSGLPLRPSTSLNSSESSEENSAEYFPGAYALGEILDEQGYNQALLMGSEAEFAGRDKYFTQHGGYDIRDYHWAVDTGRLPEDYYEWWGYEDRKLVDYAKETLNELSQEDAPFNLTMLTVDTHFEDGYATEDTPDLFGDQYSNVIHDSDRQIAQLLEWMKEQPFYEDTTVVLVGDHLTMDSDFFDSVDPDYQRSVFNLFLNTNKQKVRNKNREFSAVDMFPTTLSALGVEVPGDRLGLGVNLFSDQPTLIEQFGYEPFQNELMKKSDFYNEKLMQDDEKDKARE